MVNFIKKKILGRGGPSLEEKVAQAKQAEADARSAAEASATQAESAAAQTAETAEAATATMTSEASAAVDSVSAAAPETAAEAPVAVEEPAVEVQAAVEEAPPAEEPAPEAPAAETYTVVSGDSLSAIAERFYGDANAYMRIFEANRDKLNDPNLIYPGQELTIPR